MCAGVSLRVGALEFCLKVEKKRKRKQKKTKGKERKELIK